MFKDRLSKGLEERLEDLSDDYNFLREVYLERNQLYGYLIKLMKDHEIYNIELEFDDLTASNSHVLFFEPDYKKKVVRIKLIKNDEPEIISPGVKLVQ